MKNASPFPPTERKKYPSSCIQCGGTVAEDITTFVYQEANGNTRVVHGVPAGICQSCGERYLRAEVAAEIERLLSSAPARREEVPVWDFASNF